MEMPVFSTDAARIMWLEEQDRSRRANDRSYGFAADVGEVIEYLERSNSVFDDKEIGPVDVYELKDGRKSLAYLGVTKFDEDDPFYDDPNAVGEDWDDVPLEPPGSVLVRLQSFPFGKLPKTHELQWRLDQHRDGALSMTLFRDGRVYEGVHREPEAMKDALLSIENLAT